MIADAADRDEPDGRVLDDRLRLIFTCCHPALPLDGRVALTLRTLLGLTTAEIARAFLVTESTMAQRLVRTKRKIREAAIAACHANAPDAEATDWPQIAALYSQLARMMPTPVVRLNHAVAVAMADGPAAGLAMLAALEAAGELADYHLLPAARADLLRRMGRREAAAACYRQALQLARTDADREDLSNRLAEMRDRT